MWISFFDLVVCCNCGVGWLVLGEFLFVGCFWCCGRGFVRGIGVWYLVWGEVVVGGWFGLGRVVVVEWVGVFVRKGWGFLCLCCMNVVMDCWWFYYRVKEFFVEMGEVLYKYMSLMVVVIKEVVYICYIKF